MRRILFWITLLMGLSGIANAAPAKPGPVAVLPFQNLNKNPELAWLSPGIAETMISDLRSSGSVTVVERSQIHRALAEIALQNTQDAEVARAVSVGKLLGAKTVVVGGFQTAGSDIRITARFVAVETGVVLDTAKATGPLTRIFALQDEITDRLLGIEPRPKGKPVKRVGRPKRRHTKERVKAYELYAMSLDTATDAQRVKYLEQSVKIDPAFTYAVDDLRALERRMAAALRIADRELNAREAALVAKLKDPKTSHDQRVQVARALLDELIAGRRFYTLAREASSIYQMKLEPTLLFDAREYASYALVLSDERLRLQDLALQHGERHLREFPAGPHVRDVETLMNTIVKERREAAGQRDEYEQELAENDHDRSERLAKGPLDHEDQVGFDYKPCIAAKWSKLPDEMLANCSAFIKKYHSATDEDTVDFVMDARAFVVWAYSLKGDFKTARQLADELHADRPDQLASIGLREIIDRRWPTD